MNDQLVVELYLDSRGKSPFDLWLNKLKDPKGKQVILQRLIRMKRGNLGDSKPVGSGVFELRIHFGPGYRIYFGRDGDRLILLLLGGTKSTQDSDIQKAINSWRNYRDYKNSETSDSEF